MNPQPAPCRSRPENIGQKLPPDRQMRGTAAAKTSAVALSEASRPAFSASHAAHIVPGMHPSMTAATMLESCASVNAHVTLMYGSAAEISPMSMP